MDIFYRLRLRKDEQVVIALEMAGAIGESIAAKIDLVEAKSLNLRAHGAIENQYTLPRRPCEGRKNVGAVPWFTHGTEQFIDSNIHNAARLHFHNLDETPNSHKDMFMSTSQLCVRQEMSQKRRAGFPHCYRARQFFDWHYIACATARRRRYIAISKNQTGSNRAATDVRPDFTSLPTVAG
jgi:hypothetical protein